MKARDLLKGAAAAALLLAPVPVLAADAAGEIVTAATHADLAAKASDLAGTQMHLHHALNCLAGPGGAGFDPKSMNPCANAGNGAIPDTTDAAKKTALQMAAATLSSGLAAPDQATAQKDAADAATALKAIK
ncbi:MAG: hypothetical protein WDN03_00990 [Rhizomicrobium sp.]